MLQCIFQCRKVWHIYVEPTLQIGKKLISCLFINSALFLIYFLINMTTNDSIGWFCGV